MYRCVYVHPVQYFIYKYTNIKRKVVVEWFMCLKNFPFLFLFRINIHNSNRLRPMYLKRVENFFLLSKRYTYDQSCRYTGLFGVRPYGWKKEDVKKRKEEEIQIGIENK